MTAQAGQGAKGWALHGMDGMGYPARHTCHASAQNFSFSANLIDPEADASGGTLTGTSRLTHGQPVRHKDEKRRPRERLPPSGSRAVRAALTFAPAQSADSADQGQRAIECQRPTFACAQTAQEPAQMPQTMTFKMPSSLAADLLRPPAPHGLEIFESVHLRAEFPRECFGPMQHLNYSGKCKGACCHLSLHESYQKADILVKKCAGTSAPAKARSRRCESFVEGWNCVACERRFEEQHEASERTRPSKASSGSSGSSGSEASSKMELSLSKETFKTEPYFSPTISSPLLLLFSCFALFALFGICFLEAHKTRYGPKANFTAGHRIGDHSSAPPFQIVVAVVAPSHASSPSFPWPLLSLPSLFEHLTKFAHSDRVQSI